MLLPQRGAFFLLCLALLARLAPAEVLPFPSITVKTGEKGAVALQPRWEYGSKINVVVQKDTKTDAMGNPLNRHKALEAGIMRWQARLDKLKTDIMICFIENDDGKPPAGTVNPVPMTFEDAGTSVGEGALKGTLGADGTGAAVPHVKKDSPFFDGGKIIIQKDYMPGSSLEDALKNIGEHEFGHILGLGHDKLAANMNHHQGSEPRDQLQNQNQGLGPRDLQEFNALYKKKVTVSGTLNKKQEFTLNGASQQFASPPEVEFELASVNAEFTSFTYTASFNPTPGFDPATLHVPFLGLGIDPSLVTSVDLPPGWLLLPWNVAPDPSLPFYARDEYLLFTGLPFELQVLGDGLPANYIGLRASPEQALLDGFPGDPALSVFNPSVSITVHTLPGLRWGEFSAFGVDGEAQLLNGPVVTPEPTAAQTMFVALLVFAGLRSIPRWRRPASSG